MDDNDPDKFVESTCQPQTSRNRAASLGSIPSETKIIFHEARIIQEISIFRLLKETLRKFTK